MFSKLASYIKKIARVFFLDSMCLKTNVSK